VFEQFQGLASIFASDQGDFVAQSFDGPESDVFEIADGRCDDIEGGRQDVRIVSLDLTDLRDSQCREVLKRRMPV
jgi:hypothetical protein